MTRYNMSPSPGRARGQFCTVVLLLIFRIVLLPLRLILILLLVILAGVIVIIFILCAVHVVVVIIHGCDALLELSEGNAAVCRLLFKTHARAGVQF